MAHPKRDFNSRIADDEFGLKEGMLAQFGSINARDNFINRQDNVASFIDPDRTAQRKLGDIIYVSFAGPTTGNSFLAQNYWAEYSAHATIEKAFQDENIGDYYATAFPFKRGVFASPSFTVFPGGAFSTVPPAGTHFDYTSQVVSNANIGTAIANFVQTIAVSTRISAVYIEDGGILSYYAGYNPVARADQMRAVLGQHVIVANQFLQNTPAPVGSPNVLITENPYGRIPRDPDGENAEIDGSAEGIALQAFHDSLYTSGGFGPPFGGQFSTTMPARLYHQVQAFNGVAYIPYIRRYDQFPGNGETPF